MKKEIKKGWVTLRSKILFKNPWIKVRKDNVIRPNGKKGVYTVVETCPGVFTVAITKDKKVLMVKIMRYTNSIESWELPAGGIDKGQTPLQAAKRELLEETGHKARKWTRVGHYHEINGICENILRSFIAEDLVDTGKHEQDEEGIIETGRFTFKEIFKMIDKGVITDGETICALTQVAIRLKIIK